ncbi:MAG: hypothetical protein H6815_07320 [Phycisphaeraceae bacterium]|nr:hypothetical protein [Phycisphaerales bacterium]MCB9860251.1 hypothetical protein [Phycisphaeraceae bacterium]
MLLMILSYSSYVVHIGMTQGWMRAIPSSVLVFISPMDDAQWDSDYVSFIGFRFFIPTSELTLEAQRRFHDRELYSWQSRIYLDRIFSTEPAMMNHYVRTRDTWPLGYPLRVQLTDQLMLPITRDDLLLRVRAKGITEWASGVPTEDKNEYLKIKYPKLKRSERFRYGPIQLQLDWIGANYLTIAPASNQPRKIQIEAQVLGGFDPSDPDKNHAIASTHVIWQGVVRTIDMRGDIEETISFFESEEAKRRVEWHFGWSVDDTIAYCWNVNFSSQASGGPGPSWGIALKAELLDGETSLGSTRMIVFHPDDGVHVRQSNRTRYILSDNYNSGQNASTIQLRVATDPELCLLDFHHDVFWKGEFNRDKGADVADPWK